MVKVDIYIPKNLYIPYMRLRARLLSQFHDMTEAPMCVGVWRGGTVPIRRRDRYHDDPVRQQCTND